MYFLLFIYVPQVIIPFICTGIFNNPNTHVSGVSQAKLQANWNLMQVAIHLPPLFPPVSIVRVVDFSICKCSTDNST